MVEAAAPAMTGRVAYLARYPVKGLGGEHLQSAHLGSAGLAYDRLLALAHDRLPIAPFGDWTSYEAFHALDVRPDLGGFSAQLVFAPGRGHADAIVLTAPGGDRFSVPLSRHGDLVDAEECQAAIQSWFGKPGWTARLISSGSHLWDYPDTPVSIINVATVRDIGRVAGADLDPDRFRANLYLDGLPAWGEFDLVGHEIVIGDARLEILRPIDRCRATSVDPRDGSTAVNIPAHLTSRFGHRYCGLYARVAKPGHVRTGDHVIVGEGAVPTLAQQGLNLRQMAAAPRPATVLSTSRTADVTSVELLDPASALGRAAPGQHLRLHPIGTGDPAWRNYTLSRIGRETVRISVRLRPDGQVSPQVARLKAGDKVLVTGPFGDAVLDATATTHLLILTAGIGVTPALPIVQALADGKSRRRIDLVHVARETGGLVHWAEIEAALAPLPNGRAHLFLTGAADPDASGRRGRPMAADIQGLVEDPAATSVYICGPPSFRRDMRAAVDAAGVPADAVHFDAFYSPPPIDLRPRPAPRPGPFTVVFKRAGRTVTWTAEAGSLLDLAEANGLEPDADCRSGACGTCAEPVEGRVAYLTTPVAEPAPGTVLLCCAVPTSDLVIDP